MIVVCVKWVDLRPEIDPLTGAVTTDDRRAGFSEADQAALEVGLALAGARGTSVTLVSAGPSTADAALRDLAACGATGIVRIDAPTDLDSASVGASIAAAVRGLGDVDLVVTGDHSLDRGSGAVPSVVAYHLGWAQALGLVEIEATGNPLTVVRRLDGGRRERLTVGGPAVLSVEGSVARLRRASLSAVLAARKLDVDVAHVVNAGVHTPHREQTEPLRPRARVLPAPSGDRALQRVVELTGALVERTPPRRVEADPAAAAAEIVAQLRAWGSLE